MNALADTFAGGAPTLDQVRALEAIMLALPQVVMPPEVCTHGQVSARGILIPADTDLIGCETNFDNVSIVLGDITVTTDNGPRRLTGFHMLPASRGVKRMGRAHADTIWVTVHHTKLTSQRDIEDEMTGDLLQSRRLEIA